MGNIKGKITILSYIEEVIKLNEIQNNLLEIIRDLSEEQIAQVITFAEFLVYQKNKEIEEIGDEVVSKNIEVLIELSKYD